MWQEQHTATDTLKLHLLSALIHVVASVDGTWFLSAMLLCANGAIGLLFLDEFLQQRAK